MGHAGVLRDPAGALRHGVRDQPRGAPRQAYPSLDERHLLGGGDPGLLPGRHAPPHRQAHQQALSHLRRAAHHHGGSRHRRHPLLRRQVHRPGGLPAKPAPRGYARLALYVHHRGLRGHLRLPRHPVPHDSEVHHERASGPQGVLWGHDQRGGDRPRVGGGASIPSSRPFPRPLCRRSASPTS